MNGIVTLDLPPNTVDMEHVRIVGTVHRSSHEYAELMRVGKLLEETGAGHITVVHDSPRPERMVIRGDNDVIGIFSTSALMTELLRSNPPIPASIILRGDLGPPPRLDILPRKKAVWKEAVHGPTDRRQWQAIRTGKSFNRSGMRGR